MKERLARAEEAAGVMAWNISPFVLSGWMMVMAQRPARGLRGGGCLASRQKRQQCFAEPDTAFQ